MGVILQQKQIMDKPWIAFFSQTGAEIADISEDIGRWPDIIITNDRPAHLRTIDERIVKKGFVTVPNKPTVEELKLYLNQLVPKDTIVTLHGWLRIMPKELCEEFNIYNGHPGLITKYPELKGKDPQVRAYEGIKEGRYVMAGAVLHKVIPEVDEGKIIAEEYFNGYGLSLEGLFLILKDRSLYMWTNFLKNVL